MSVITLLLSVIPATLSTFEVLGITTYINTTFRTSATFVKSVKDCGLIVFRTAIKLATVFVSLRSCLLAFILKLLARFCMIKHNIGFLDKNLGLNDSFSKSFTKKNFTKQFKKKVFIFCQLGTHR